MSTWQVGNRVVATWQYQSGGLPRFRCRTGHAYSPLSLLASQSGGIDDALNQAFRALKEKEHMERRMAKLTGSGSDSRGATYHTAQAERAANAAASIFRVLIDLRSKVVQEKAPGGT